MKRVKRIDADRLRQQCPGYPRATAKSASSASYSFFPSQAATAPRDTPDCRAARGDVARLCRNTYPSREWQCK